MKETTTEQKTASVRKKSTNGTVKKAGTRRKPQTATAKKNPQKRGSKKTAEERRKDFYHELLGLALLGIGIFSMISMLSTSVGILGESIRDMLVAILGAMAYVFPLLVLLMGASLILRKPQLFSNKKTYGILLVAVVSAMLLSLNRMETVHREGFLVTLRNLMNIRDINHGGILGMVLAVPLYRLIGPLGTYIVAGCLYVIALILIFNTTIYDFLRKSNEQRLATKGKLEIRREEKKKYRAQRKVEKQEQRNEEKLVEEKLKILDLMNGKDEPQETSDTLETKSPFVHLDVEDSEGLLKTVLKEDEISKELLVEKSDSGEEPHEITVEMSSEKRSLDSESSEKTLVEDKPRITREKRKAEESIEAIQGEQLELEEVEKPAYEFPEIALLKQNIKGMLANEDRDEILENAKKLEDTLMSFGVEARVIHVSKGPSVTRYELQPKAGVKVSRIVNLADDIALALAARGVRIEAPIPGKAAVGIEIPNKETTAVYLREVIEDPKFQRSTSKISVALGKDISGEAIIGDLSKMPHVLIAGATGSGKSVCINSLIISILYKYDPEHVRLLMVDPKVVELNVYNGIPHLLIPVVTDPKKAAGALNWAVNEMTRRYQSFAEYGVRNIEGFNELAKKNKELESLPYIVVIVDELADLMMVSANEVEDYIARLAQMARAAGMHLVIATQRPSVDVITGVIKANIPSRISFAVSSAIDSRTILDSGGAEKLLGKGDMLYYPVGEQKPKRIQGAFISEEEVEAIVSRIKVQKDQLIYDQEIMEHIEKGRSDQGDGEEGDELYQEAVKVVVENQQASTSFLQRKMRIGYNRAARIMDQLEERGVISSRDGAKPRQVLMSEYQLREE